MEIADKVKFPGHLHFLHVTNSDSVDLVDNARKSRRVSCGVTPHHLLLDDRCMNFPYGILYKVNPPLRGYFVKEELFRDFEEGRVDVIESDHAPHTHEDKFKRHMSGFPNLASWPNVLNILRARGVSRDLIYKAVYSTVNGIFGTQIPRLNLPVKSHVHEYLFDLYKDLKEGDSTKF